MKFKIYISIIFFIVISLSQKSFSNTVEFNSFDPAVIHFENCISGEQNISDLTFGGADIFVFQKEGFILFEDFNFSFRVINLQSKHIRTNPIIGQGLDFDSELDIVQKDVFNETFNLIVSLDKNSKTIQEIYELKIDKDSISDMFDLSWVNSNIQDNGIIQSAAYKCEKVSEKDVFNEYPLISNFYHTVWKFSNPLTLKNYYIRLFDDPYCQWVEVDNHMGEPPTISFPYDYDKENCRFYFRFFDGQLGMYVDFNNYFFSTDDANSTFMDGYLFQTDNTDNSEEMSFIKVKKLAPSEVTYEDRSIAYSFNKVEDYFDFDIELKEKPSKPKFDNEIIVVEKKDSETEIQSNEPRYLPIASGSGFYISKQGHLVTNYHVIEGCDLNLINFEGKNYDSVVLGQDPTNDLALLKVEIEPKDIYPIESRDPNFLEDIIIAGYPLGKNVSSSIKSSKGSVTSVTGFGDNYSNFQTDAALNQGNSGGPIINYNGNVVGVAVATYAKEEGVESFNFGIKSSVVRTFLNSLSIGIKEPNKTKKDNSELGKLIFDATAYIECWMTEGKILKLLEEENTKKALFKIN